MHESRIVRCPLASCGANAIEITGYSSSFFGEDLGILPKYVSIECTKKGCGYMIHKEIKQEDL